MVRKDGSGDVNSAIKKNQAYLNSRKQILLGLVNDKDVSPETKKSVQAALAELETLSKKASDPKSYRRAQYNEKEGSNSGYIFNPAQTGLGGTTIEGAFEPIVEKLNFVRAGSNESEGVNPLVKALASAAGDAAKNFYVELEKSKAASEAFKGGSYTSTGSGLPSGSRLNTAGKTTGNTDGGVTGKTTTTQTQAKAQTQANAKETPVSGDNQKVTYGGSGDPKVGDKMRLPTGSKRDGANVKTEYTEYVYTKEGWTTIGGKKLDGATQEKITKAYSTPVGTQRGQYQYIGNGNWTDTNGAKGNTVNPSTAKDLFLQEEKEKGKESTNTWSRFRTNNNGTGANAYDPKMDAPNLPDRTVTTGKGLAGGGQKKEEAPVSTRETTVPEGIQTKSVLDAESLAGIFRRSEENVDASMPGLKDSSGTFTDTGEKKASAFGDLASYAEYLPDFFKMGLGLLGANQKVPEYEIPKEFIDFKQKAREMSDQGLEAEELAKAYQDTERAYAYDTKAIRDMSGGRAGLALANLGRATDSLGQRYGAINAADAAMRRENRAQYGGVLADYVGLDRTMFEDKRQLALLNKEAGANLAADAMSNIDNRMEYNKTYGKGSIYERYMKQLEEGVGLQNDIYKYQLENPGTLPGANITSVPAMPVPNFFSTYYGMNGNGKVE